MSDHKIKSVYRGVDRRAPRPAADEAVGYREAGRRAKIGGRHAAITNDLYSWHSYKSWADRMRGTWDEKK
ncbi:MAG: hypothetical protein KGL34_04770 [Gammaproteobacteria bacterium]|nr:hypothetical protein [Gammaproteobacteria bacterium]